VAATAAGTTGSAAAEAGSGSSSRGESSRSAAAEAAAAGSAAPEAAAAAVEAGDGCHTSFHAQLSQQAGALFGVLETFLRAKNISPLLKVDYAVRMAVFCHTAFDGKPNMLLELAQQATAMQQVGFFNLLVILLKLSAKEACNPTAWTDADSSCEIAVAVAAGAVAMLRSCLQNSKAGSAAAAAAAAASDGSGTVPTSSSSSSSSSACPDNTSKDLSEAAALWLLLLGCCCWAASACNGRRSWHRCKLKVPNGRSSSGRHSRAWSLWLLVRHVGLSCLAALAAAAAAQSFSLWQTL
jgi:hypothetical protein